MKQRRVHAEHLLGRIVYDIDGCKVGRIEEIEVEQTNRGCYVESFVLGHVGLLKRLSIRGIAPLFFPALVTSSARRDRGVPWDKIAISDPKRPRLCCRRDEL